MAQQPQGFVPDGFIPDEPQGGRPPGFVPDAAGAAPTTPPAQPRTWLDTARDILKGVAFPGADPLVGAVKGAANTAIGIGEMVLSSQNPVAGPAIGTAADQLRSRMQPQNTGEKIGYYGEQIAEFALPGAAARRLTGAGGAGARLLASRLGAAAPPTASRAARVGTEAALNAGLAKAQTGEDSAAGLAAGMTVGMSGATRAIASAGRLAEPLVRSAIKPTVTAMKRIAGASSTGIDAKANQLVRWIVENRVTTPEKALGILKQAETELEVLLKVRTAATDAPQRATRYLQALERSAARQGLGAEDVATLRNKAAELLEGPMGNDIVVMVPTPHKTLVGPNGKPLIVLQPQTTRALRTNVSAAEALQSARDSGTWGTRKAWGEMKGAATSAKKAVERGQRDAVKTAVPEARPLLQTEGKAAQAREVLDRMAFREANREPVGLTQGVVAAGEIASGRLPIFGFAMNLIRNNQLKSGVLLDKLKKAIDRSDERGTVAFLRMMGTAIPPQYTKMRD